MDTIILTRRAKYSIPQQSYAPNAGEAVLRTVKPLRGMQHGMCEKKQNVSFLHISMEVCIHDLTPTGNTPLSSPSQVALETLRKATAGERQA